MQFRCPPQGFVARGFTLIEVMITVAIVAILASLAYPSYADFVRRSRLIDATTRLSNFRVRMEQQFMDTRAYPATVGDCNNLIALTDPNGAGKWFTLVCTASTNGPPAAYTIEANGFDNFRFTIDQANLRQTLTVHPGWSGAGSNCWVIRSDGSC